MIPNIYCEPEITFGCLHSELGWILKRKLRALEVYIIISYYFLIADD